MRGGQLLGGLPPSPWTGLHRPLTRELHDVLLVGERGVVVGQLAPQVIGQPRHAIGRGAGPPLAERDRHRSPPVYHGVRLTGWLHTAKWQDSGPPASPSTFGSEHGRGVGGVLDLNLPVARGETAERPGREPSCGPRTGSDRVASHSCREGSGTYAASASSQPAGRASATTRSSLPSHAKWRRPCSMTDPADT